MADDTRQNIANQLKQNPDDKPFSSGQWSEAAPSHKPPENANLMPGGTEHTAGGRVADVGVVDAAKSIKLEDWNDLPKKPCVRDSFLTGIGAGFSMGAVRAIWRGTKPFQLLRFRQGLRLTGYL